MHELVHFALKDFGLNKFVEEAVCFLFERMFILDTDGIELEDFEYEKGTDDFHRRAIACSRDFYEDFLVFFANGDRDGLFRYLDENIDTDAKRATITRSLTDYLATNG